ncbi:MAG: S-layer protein, partial [Gemmataceae bacterium]
MTLSARTSATLAGLLWLAYPAHAADRAVSFTNDVVPVLTRAGCNMGVCHAKAGGGRNGFQLSLLGFEPAEDFEHIVLEGRGRRLSFGDPDRSLLLLKASGQVSHGGGRRLAKDSAGYATVRDWIAQGVPKDDPAGPRLVALEVEPKKGSLRRQATQQLKALARYSDGVVRDVTGVALFESNDKALAEASEDGLVRVADLPGKVSVMVRYQGMVTVFNA